MKFKEIDGYPNYLIYEDGRVWTNTRDRFKSNKIGNRGYLQIQLYKNCKPKTFYIHRLVALHFVENPENKPCIDHKDGIRTNNSSSNLRWVTYKENNCNMLKYKGVRYRNDNRKKNWVATWSVDGKCYRKCFLTEVEAVEYRKLMVEKYYNRPIIT